MKILFFDDFKLGILTQDGVVDVTSVVKDVPHSVPHDLINGVIERFGEYRKKLEEAAAIRSGYCARQGQDPSAAAASDQYRLHGGQLHGGRHAHRTGAHQRLSQVAQLR